MIISLDEENSLKISDCILWKKYLGVNKDTRDILNLIISHYSKPIAHIKLNGEICKLTPLIHKKDKVVHPNSIYIQSTI